MSETLTKSFKSICSRNPDVCAKTKLKNIDFVFEWSIEDLNYILDRNYEIPSPSFTFNKESNEKWRLILFPKHIYPSGTNLAVSLIKLTPSEKPLCLRYFYSFFDKQGNVHQTKLREKNFSKVFDFDECILLNQALMTESKFLPNNCFTIRCEINTFLYVDSNDLKIECPVKLPIEKLNNRGDTISSTLPEEEHLKNFQSFYNKSTEKENNLSYNKYNISNDVTEETFNTTVFTKAEESSLSDLSNNLKALYISKDFSDIIICTNDAEIKAHKAILSTSSDYFKNMFASKKENKLTLNIETDILTSYLLYLYSGIVREMSIEKCLNLLSASKTFGDLHCQELVTNVIKDNITVDNVTDILQHSENLKLSDLKYECLKFVNLNNSKVMQTEKWKEMIKSNPHIAGQALLTIASYQKKNVL